MTASITQRELAHELVLKKQSREAAAEWKAVKRDILDRLQRGAVVEPGPITVEYDIRTKI